MELLSRTGSSPALGPIEKVGTKKAGYEIKAERIMRSSTDIVDRLCVLTVNAIEQKRKKENSYPANTWLIVRFHDEFKLGYEQLIEEATEAARNSQFGKVYLVGGSGTRFCQQVWEG